MTDRRKIHKHLRIWTAVLAIAIVLGYAAFAATDFVRGPTIEVASPSDGSVSASRVVEISGTAKNLSFLTLNGDKIYTDESGAFSERILLSDGYNVMTLEAQDRFGRTARKTLQLIHH